MNPRLRYHLQFTKQLWQQKLGGEFSKQTAGDSQLCPDFGDHSASPPSSCWKGCAPWLARGNLFRFFGEAMAEWKKVDFWALFRAKRRTAQLALSADLENKNHQIWWFPTGKMRVTWTCCHDFLKKCLHTHMQNTCATYWPW